MSHNKIAELINQRIRDMKRGDAESGEHTNATEEEYVAWAIEETIENRELIIAVDVHCKACDESMHGVLTIHHHVEKGVDVTK